MTKGQKLTKSMCTSAAPVSAEGGREGRESGLVDAGDGSVKGFGLRVTAKGGRIFILMYRAGKGRAAPLRKVTIGPLQTTMDGRDCSGQRLKLLCWARRRQDVIRLAPSPRSGPWQKAGVEAKDSVRAAVDEWTEAGPGRQPDGRRGTPDQDRQVPPVWGDTTLASIRKRDVIELVDGIADRGAKVAANRALAYVRRFFNWAAGRDMIEANPAQYVEKPADEVRRDRVLDDLELVEVWRGVEGMSLPFAAGVRLLMLTAARRSEIFDANRE